MRRLLMLLLLAAALLPDAGPVRAQATADQLNKLSLEALTAPSSGGGGGYSRRSYRPYGGGAVRARRAYSRQAYSRQAYSHRSYYGGRRSYARHRYASRGGYRRVRPSYRRYAAISPRRFATRRATVRPSYRIRSHARYAPLSTSHHRRY